jgi:RNA polymerase sigma-70 factor (ECF subfamily)
MSQNSRDLSPEPASNSGDAPDDWGRLLERARLRKLVALRLDPRLQGRVDPSDVIQEAYLDAATRLPEYTQEPERMPFYLWLRFLVGQRILEQHRRHLGAQARDVGREVSLYRGPMPEASSAAIAAQLIGRQTSPSQAAIRLERKLRLQEALNGMDPIDREALVLRHYEQLTNSEAALVLGLDKSAASKRYARALIRLKDLLSAMPGGLQEP